MSSLRILFKFNNLKQRPFYQISNPFRKMVQPNLKSKRIIGLFTFLFLIMGGIFLRSAQNQSQERDISEYTVSARRGTLPGLVTASGELQAEKTVNISPKRQGLIEKIYVTEGDKVVKGQLIAEMDSGDLFYQLNELKDNLETQKSRYERRKMLYREGAISKEVYEEYKNLYKTSVVRLQQKEVERSEILIRAPFNGLVTTRYAITGAFVTPTTASSSANGGSANTSIIELSQGLEVIAKVPESDIGRIKNNQSAIIRVDAFPEKRFQAEVIEIAPRAIKSNNVTSFEVTLELKKQTPKLRIGMTADIEFMTGETSLNTLVPTVAIVTREGKPGLLVSGKNYQPEFKEVELGTSAGSQTAILKGLKVGELVFINLPPWAKDPGKK